jgi:hypothetical protein
VSARIIQADVNAPEKHHGSTPVYIAAEMGQVDALQCLVELKGDLATPNLDGTTPLWIATQEGHVEAITALAKLKADVSGAGSSAGAPPLFIASDPTAIATLVRLKADPNAELPEAAGGPGGSSGGSSTPLLNATVKHLRGEYVGGEERPWLAAIKGLAAAKGDVNAPTSQESGFSLCCLAAQQGGAHSVEVPRAHRCLLYARMV